MLVALDTPVFPGNDEFEECAMMFFFMLSMFAFMAMFLHVRLPSPDVLLSKQKYAGFFAFGTSEDIALTSNVVLNQLLVSLLSLHRV